MSHLMVKGSEKVLIERPRRMCPYLGKDINQEAAGILCSGLYNKQIQMLEPECQLSSSINCSVDVARDLVSFPAVV